MGFDDDQRWGDEPLSREGFAALSWALRVRAVRMAPVDEAAHVLGALEGDDAVDVLRAIEPDRARAVVERLAPGQGRRARVLLGVDPVSAEGLRRTHFPVVRRGASVADAVAAVRAQAHPDRVRDQVWVINGRRRLVGVALLAAMAGEAADVEIDRLCGAAVQVGPHAGLEEMARLLRDRDARALAVVDDGERLLGVVDVDDILELVLPVEWARVWSPGG